MGGGSKAGAASAGVGAVGEGGLGALTQRAAPREQAGGHEMVRGWRTRERLVVFGDRGESGGFGVAGPDREEAARGSWRDSIGDGGYGLGGRDGDGGGAVLRRGQLSAQSGRSGQSEVSDLCDLSHAESEAEASGAGGERRGGTCEYLVRTLTRTLLELQAAIEAEHDVDTCTEALALLRHAALVPLSLLHPRSPAPLLSLLPCCWEGYGVLGGVEGASSCMLIQARHAWGACMRQRLDALGCQMARGASGAPGGGRFAGNGRGALSIGGRMAGSRSRGGGGRLSGRWQAGGLLEEAEEAEAEEEEQDDDDDDGQEEAGDADAAGLRFAADVHRGGVAWEVDVGGGSHQVSCLSSLHPLISLGVTEHNASPPACVGVGVCVCVCVGVCRSRQFKTAL